MNRRTWGVTSSFRTAGAAAVGMGMALAACGGVSQDAASDANAGLQVGAGGAAGAPATTGGAAGQPLAGGSAGAAPTVGGASGTGAENGGGTQVSPAPDAGDVGTQPSTQGEGADAQPSHDAQCRATCETPAGDVHDFSSLDEIYSVFVGRWQICKGLNESFLDAPADVVGVEYGPVPDGGHGRMYYLVQGPSGPVRGAGFDYQLTYDVYCWPSVTGDLGCQLNMHPAPNSGYGASFRYSPCPKELEIFPMYASAGTVFVPFD
jgi:hypothetical protein